MNKNGFLIQDFNAPTEFVKNIKYKGINSYHIYPLSNINNDFCRKLTEKQQFKKTDDDLYYSLEFISNYNFLKEYLDGCLKYNISTRILFIESMYEGEIYNDKLPQMQFIGYEYCPIPIDEQIITDLDWCSPLYKYHDKLNEFGLFDSFVDVLEFKSIYDKACENQSIGDGVSSSFVCKVFLVLQSAII